MERRKNPLGTVSKTIPFYEPPLRKTSAEIINEAKAIITGTAKLDETNTITNVKPLFTERPFTPKENDRIFFGKKTTKNNRPPSSFSLRYLQEQSELNIPSTLPESNAEERSFTSYVDKEESQLYDSPSYKYDDNKIFNVQVRERCPQKIKLPALEPVKTVQKPKKTQKESSSFDADSNGNYSSFEKEIPESNRNAFSSPQERTNFSDNISQVSFGKVSRHNSLSSCLILEPQNLDKLFGNRQIVENSETLFEKTGYFNYVTKQQQIAKTTKSISTETLEPLTLQELIKLLNSESSKHKNDELIINLLKKLDQRIKEEEKISSKLKITILKCLYKYVEADNQKMLINIAKILLFLKVTGNNLSGVCKLIFKISKNGENDHLFLEEKILDLFLDALGRSSPLEDGEACIYGYGAIKFLTTNSEILDNVLDLGILPLMVLHMKIINNAKMENMQIQEQTNNVLFQLTGTLRNLVLIEEKYDNFISSGAITQLCCSLKLFSNDLDVTSTISRNLSHLSSDDKCCDTITECDHIFITAIDILNQYAGNEEIVVRVAYTLGNTVARSDSARTKLYSVKNCVRILIKLWRTYLDLTLKHCSMKSETKEERENSTEDVMVKLIRIIANLSMNANIGKEISRNFGVQLIDELLKVLISNPFRKNEELVLSVLTTLNNLSYYYITDIESDIYNTKEVEIMDALREYVKGRNRENKLEAMRILGNLSRSKITRSYIVRNELVDVLSKNLNEDDQDLLETTIGVFINLMSDPPAKEAFQKKDGLSKLIQILKKHGQNDWNLSTLICQTIWNYCIDAKNLYDLISDIELEKLMVLLADRLDEEKLFGIKDIAGNADICSSVEFLAWEEFAFVATNLLEKIEHFLEVIQAPSPQDENNSKRDSSTNVKDVVDSSTNLTFAAW